MSGLRRRGFIEFKWRAEGYVLLGRTEVGGTGAFLLGAWPLCYYGYI